jgi:hypothetical protein
MEKKPCPHPIGGWIDPVARLRPFGRGETLLPRRETNPGPSSPYPSHYTDYAIPPLAISHNKQYLT